MVPAKPTRCNGWAFEADSRGLHQRRLGGTFQERLDDTVETYSSCPEVMEIIDFIRADANRPLCLPEREV